MPKWLVSCTYNGQKTGSGQFVSEVLDGEDPVILIREAWMTAMRRENRKGGGGIYITGLSCQQIPE